MRLYHGHGDFRVVDFPDLIFGAIVGVGEHGGAAVGQGFAAALNSRKLMTQLVICVHAHVLVEVGGRWEIRLVVHYGT